MPRAAGISLGAFSLLLLVTHTGDVHLKRWFADWLFYLEAVLAGPLDVVKMLLIDSVLAFIRGFDWQPNDIWHYIPDLNQVWRDVFVLNWLLATALTRNVGPVASWLIGFVTAVFGALVAGLSPGIGLFVADTPAALAVTVAVVLAVAAALVVRGAVTTVAAATGAAAVAVTLGTGAAVVPIWMVIVFAVTLAAIFSVIGIMRSWRRGLRAMLNEYAVNVGLDIVSAVAIAFLLVATLAQPPLW